jgi:hypothetical protein
VPHDKSASSASRHDGVDILGFLRRKHGKLCLFPNLVIAAAQSRMPRIESRQMPRM